MRRPFSRIEDSLEFIVERPFSMLFRRSVQPVEVGKRLKKELSSGEIVTVRGRVALNDYVVLLNPADIEPYMEYGVPLGDDLAEWLEESAARSNLATLGPMIVRFQSDSSVRRGRIEIRASVQEPDPTQIRFEDPGRTEPFDIAGREEQGTRGYIEICSGPSTGAIFPIRKQLVSIGRDLGNDLVIDSPEVSRFHADLQSSGGMVIISDRNSMNGTFVNGFELRGPHAIESGDQVMFGTTICRYWSDLL